MEESKTAKTFWLVVLSGFGFVVHFLAAPFIARALPVFDNGMYHQVILVADVFFLLLSFGFQNIMLMYLRRSDVKSEEVFWSGFVFLIGIALVGTLLMYSSAPAIDQYFEAGQRLAPLIQLYSVFLVFKLPMAATEAAFILFGRTKTIVKRNIFLNILQAGALIFAVQYFKTVEALVIALVFNTAAAFALSFVLVPARFKQSISFSKSLLKTMFSDGTKLSFNSVIGQTSLMLDKLILSSSMSPAAFAIYRNGAIEPPFFGTIYRTISNMVLPELSKLASEKRDREIVLLKRRITSNTALLVYPMMVFFVIFAEDFIRLYLSEKYIESAPVFQIFALTLLFRINAHSDILMAKRAFRKIIHSSVILLLVTITATVSLIALYGIMGAAVAYFIMVLTSVSLLSWFSAKTINCKATDFFDFKLLISCIAVPVTVAIVIKLLAGRIDGVLAFIAILVGFGAVSYYVLLRLFVRDHSVIILILRHFQFRNINLGSVFTSIFPPR